MHLHILGICGTFMGGIALLARALGHRVTGSDANVYPPMSTQLEAAGIKLMEGYAAGHLDPEPDLVVVGNAMKRGLPVVEYLLNQGLPYVSGPEWLKVNVLRNRWVLAVAGTHGKTTASSMLAWVLDYAGLNPGFLIGGVPQDFGLSARLGAAPFFVVEADEYDTAFFDKRSKFVHYLPRTLVLNNLEFDHADIFDDLAMIQRQFHHLVRIVPGSGIIIHPQGEAALDQVLAMGCWTPRESVGAGGDWSAALLARDGSHYKVLHGGHEVGEVNWRQTGNHNVANALAVLAAARHAGVSLEQGIEALNHFQGVKRRMELRGKSRGIPVYDDFAHHPTAIATTLEGLRRHAKVAELGGRILAVLEPRSNTMRLGVHNATLAASLDAADLVYIFAPPDLGWDAGPVFSPLGARAAIFSRVEDIVAAITHQVRVGDQILVMSNGGFQGIHDRLLKALKDGH